MTKRFGTKAALVSFIKPAFFYLFVATALVFFFGDSLDELKGGMLVGIAFLAVWRYGLLLVNYLRAIIYAWHVYPQYLKTIEAIDFDARFPDTIYFIIPSYKEDSWVTTEVFQSLIEEINRVPCNAVIVVSTATDYEDGVIRNVYDSHPNTKNMKIIFQKQNSGKRIAMGNALRVVAREYNKNEEDTNSVTFFMDGDTYIPLDTLKKSLPFFKIDSKLGALTTNEVGLIESQSNWYKDWFSLKFAQRHLLFQSHSLSKRVLTLTGRFSLFRTTAVIQEGFISLIENDIIIDPNFGKFRFLMGDDKSSWYYMMKQGWNLLYLPDVIAYSLESRDGDFLEISRTLPYRWYGNTLRNNKRARALKNQPLFIKYLFYDQLALMWTSLAGVVAVIFLSIFKSIFYLPLYLAWVIYVRIFQMGVFSSMGHKVSLRTLPLMLYGQWYGSYIKIRAFFNLTDQKWSKAGGEVQTADNDTAVIEYRIAKYYSNYRMYFFVSVFLLLIATIQTQLLKLPTFDLLASEMQSKNEILFSGVVNDSKDDAFALNKLIKNVPDDSVIRLPRGRLDIYEPILISRSNITIIGDGTLLISHLHNKEEAVINIFGKKGYSVGVTQSGTYNSIKLDVKLKRSVKQKQLLLLEQANDEAFVYDTLGSKKWYKKYPILRSEIIEAARYEEGQIVMQFVSKSQIEANAKIYEIFPVSNVALKDISIDSIFDTQKYKHVYENVDENLKIDGIKMQYASYIDLENISIKNSGSNPLVFERTYNCYANNIFIDGAMNKGKEGSGYLRFNKSFHNYLSNIHVKNIRHIVFQWSSAYNTIDGLYSEADVNFHGGASHDNRVQNASFHVDLSKHKWGKVYITPKDAKWAPPDFDTNTVEEIKNDL